MTSASVLRQAAAGRWDRFLQLYLQPCCREIALIGRRHGFSETDGDDILQTLLVRLLRLGRSRSSKTSPDDETFDGNLPARFLHGGRSGVAAARFRTYLKATILNIVREELRRRKRRPRTSLDDVMAECEPFVERSIEQSLGLEQLAWWLHRAAQRLAIESAAETTRGKSRYFDLLLRSITANQSPGYIADEYGIDRTNVARLTTAARARFVELLRQESSLTDLADCKALLKARPELLQSAFLNADQEQRARQPAAPAERRPPRRR